MVLEGKGYALMNNLKTNICLDGSHFELKILARNGIMQWQHFEKDLNTLVKDTRGHFTNWNTVKMFVNNVNEVHKFNNEKTSWLTYC